MRFTQNAKKMSNAIQYKITKYIKWVERGRERERARASENDTVSDGL